ncbi:MAG: hypothetical protein CSA75_01330 [Sorangium cellulosum]|nr:MAG: hypothetical protein CSA75_01330 [Sorangium cellulosum]
MQSVRLQGEWFTTTVVGLLSFVPRLYASLSWAREPVWDGHYYDFGARRIAEGFGYADTILVDGVEVWHPWCHYPVGYSGFLAGLYALFGSGQHVAPLANAVLGVLVVMLTHRIALHWLSSRRAVVASFLCAINLELIFYSPLVMTELLATLGPLGALWVALIYHKSHRWRALVLAGIALGLSTLVHPQSIVLAPVVGLIFGFGNRLWSAKRIGTTLVITAVSLAVVGPWTYRNCRVMDACAFVSTNGGWNLAIGSFPRATGRFETLRASDGCEEVTGQVHQDRCWAELGISMIRRDPGRWLGLIPKKLGYCFDHASFPVEYLHQADPGAWPENVRVWWRHTLTGMHRVLLSVATFAFVAAGVRNRRLFLVEAVLRAALAAVVAYAWSARMPTFWPLAIAIVFTALIPRPSSPRLGRVGLMIVASLVIFIVTHIVFFGEDRYHVPLLPMICMLAAGAFRSPARDNWCYGRR